MQGLRVNKNHSSELDPVVLFSFHIAHKEDIESFSSSADNSMRNVNFLYIFYSQKNILFLIKQEESFRTFQSHWGMEKHWT